MRPHSVQRKCLICIGNRNYAILIGRTCKNIQCCPVLSVQCHVPGEHGPCDPCPRGTTLHYAIASIFGSTAILGRSVRIFWPSGIIAQLRGIIFQSCCWHLLIFVISVTFSEWTGISDSHWKCVAVSATWFPWHNSLFDVGSSMGSVVNYSVEVAL